MITINLGELKKFKDNAHMDRRLAVNWLVERYGPHGDRWTIKDLTYVQFRKERDADLFLLTWT